MSHLRQHNIRISYKIPLGYDLARDGMTLLPNQSEQNVISRIVEQRQKGMTLSAIAHSLADDKVATKQGGQWAPNTVLAIIRRHEKMAA
jgi:hypothetical protein